VIYDIDDFTFVGIEGTSKGHLQLDDDRMIVQIDYAPDDDPYNIVLTKNSDGTWHGYHQPDDYPVEAFLSKQNDKYVGRWFENRKEYILKFTDPIQPPF
jgi:hypothetical protein